ncbi:methylamine methyltransferase corrinoid protein reductive activase [Methanohalobium sp.]|uniref:methylamine methyltransferase corrinoid protein reductive activase n=1 Tax=Methanohalobium sp. TaxID=2837493 RepID=UPI0025DD0407|nr:methylamine methyltransferase corrinoid protein reductive activase [Methanohalobium sp.]
MYGIAMDLGTSGIRAQLIDLDTEETIKTVLTMRHPLPGGNVIDQLDFAIQLGEDVATEIIQDTVEEIIDNFNIDLLEIKKLSVCGNPIQLSLIQNTEIRDLAYAGESMQKKLGVENVKRDAKVVPANEVFKNLNLPNCTIIIPPSIQHEVGADALAMMIETDFMNQKEPSMVTDYGTNAEMALKVGDRIITGSAAAGPAIEGQGINCGMLAGPGAITDVNPEGNYWRLTVLDDSMLERKGDLVDPVAGEVIEQSETRAIGITGTGMISLLSVALETGLIKTMPKLPDGRLILGGGIEITEDDVREAGKAVGAIRASHLTMLMEAGLNFKDLENMYMTGASGTYVDADKARRLGICPGSAKNIVQFGNTSISLAKELILNESKLDEVVEFAHKIETDHLMMAKSEMFKLIYSCEFSYWTQGMPLEMYDQMLKSFNIQGLPKLAENPRIEKQVTKDINDLGKESVQVLRNLGIVIERPIKNCSFCYICEDKCPEKALKIVSYKGDVYQVHDSQRCLGVSCKRCVNGCPKKAIQFKNVKVLSTHESPFEIEQA